MPAATSTYYVPEALPQRVSLAVGVFFILTLLPIVAVATVDQRALTGETIIGWLLVDFCALRIAMHSADGRMRIMTLTFWVFTYVWMALAPLLEAVGEHYPEQDTYSRELVLLGFLIIFLGIAAYELGMVIGWSDSRALDRFAERFFLERKLRLWRVLAMGILSLVSVIGIVAVLGGPSVLFEPRAIFFQRLGEAAGEGGLGNTNQAMTRVLYTTLRVVPFVAFFGAFAYWRENRRLKRRTPFILMALTVMLGIVNVVVSNPIASPRAWFGTIVLTMAFFCFPWKRRRTFAAWAVGFILMLIVFFPYADAFRAKLDSKYKVDLSPKAISAQLMDKLDYGAFQQLLNTEEYVEKYGISYGRQFAGAALFWVPRRIWRDKPLPSGALIAEFKGYVFVALSLDLWTESYLNGGIGCIVVIFLFYGIISGICERTYLKSLTREVCFGSLAIPIFAAHQLMILRGDFFTALVYGIPLAILPFLLTSRSRGVRPT